MISCVTSSITISVYFGVKLNGHNYGDVKTCLHSGVLVSMSLHSIICLTICLQSKHYCK